MRHSILCLLAASLQAADPVPPRTSVGSQDQRTAVEGQMEASLAAQRASIDRQRQALSKGPFFQLPPAGATAPAQPDCAPLDPLNAASLIRDAARRSDLDPDLLHTVARQESGLRPCVTSPKGAMGLMQLMPSTARELGVTDPFDPAQSIDGGARLLRKYLDMFGSLPLALGAYNAGPARVNEAGGVPRIRETLDYVQNILSLAPDK